MNPIETLKYNFDLINCVLIEYSRLKDVLEVHKNCKVFSLYDNNDFKDLMHYREHLIPLNSEFSAFLDGYKIDDNFYIISRCDLKSYLYKLFIDKTITCSNLFSNMNSYSIDLRGFDISSIPFKESCFVNSNINELHISCFSLLSDDIIVMLNNSNIEIIYVYNEDLFSFINGKVKSRIELI